MPRSDFDFTYKFFRPPQRTVPFHNGLLDIRTKHTIAQDRLVVAEQRILDAERRKSVSNLQSITFEQKQVEKRLALLKKNYNSIDSYHSKIMRDRSTSEIILRSIRRSSSWTSPKLSISLNDSKQNLLALPKLDDYNRRFSALSDGDTPFFTSDISSGEENEYSKSSPKILKSRRKTFPKVGKQKKPILPILAVIPPEEDTLFLTQ